MFKTVKALCEEMSVDPHTIYMLAARRDDPLPLRYLPGKQRNGCVLESEMGEWFVRNGMQYQERGKDDRKFA